MQASWSHCAILSTLRFEVCQVLVLNHRAQHKSWRGIPLWANLTNQPGWDQYFLSLCLLTRASQWEHRNEVKTVDKAGVLGFHMSTSVGGRLRCVQVHAVYLAWFYLTISVLPAFQSSSNGVTLGTPNKATITILSNDNAFGIIAFNSVRNPSTCILSSFWSHPLQSVTLLAVQYSLCSYYSRCEQQQNSWSFEQSVTRHFFIYANYLEYRKPPKSKSLDFFQTRNSK